MNDDELEITVGCEAAHPDQRGGQHVARQCTSVRVRHRPTGIEAVSHERSQFRSRQVALEMLRAELADRTPLTQPQALESPQLTPDTD